MISSAHDAMYTFPGGYEIENGIFIPLRSEDLAPFSYSDGKEFEERIHNIIQGARDKSLFSSEIRNAIWDWRSACHLSPVRANILRPLEAICRGRVLELGAGCGIITRYLGELGGEITALEASLFRSGITRGRTQDLPNVEVVCDRIERFQTERSFDVVTMIGVLQYARLFSGSSPNGEIAQIAAAARQLSGDGVLVIAIQNRLSLRSMAGCPEPNVGLPYFGIENNYGDDTIVRFGREEIKRLLESAGLRFHAVLLPLPDYHMPVTILNEPSGDLKGPFNAEPLLCASVGRDRSRPDWVRPQFSLERAWESTHASGATPYLSNAFLVVAGRTERSLSFHREMKEYAWHYSVDRHPGFAIQKRFVAAGAEVLVEVSRLQSTPPPDVPLTHVAINEPYIAGKLWWQSLVHILNRPGWSVDDIAAWTRPWLTALQPPSGESPYNPEDLLPGSLFDCTPLNCVHAADGSLSFVDREWEVEHPLTLAYLLLRGLFGSLVSVSSCAKPAPGTPLLIIDLMIAVLKRIGVELTQERIDRYVTQESTVQSWVMYDRAGDPTRDLKRFVYGACLDCRVAPDELRRTIDELEVQLQLSQAELQATREDVERVKRSASWRLTAPFRALREKLQKSSISLPPTQTQQDDR